MRVKYAIKNCQVCTGVSQPQKAFESVVFQLLGVETCNNEQMILIGQFLILCFKLTNRRSSGVTTIDTILAGKIKLAPALIASLKPAWLRVSCACKAKTKYV